MNRYKYELKFKKQFPFVYIHKRPEYTTERIIRQANEVYDLLVVIQFISIPLKIYSWCKRCLDG